MSTDKKANASGRTGPIAHDLGKIRVGRLPTMNQDEYPGLSGWWVQLRIGEDGEEVLARVYGNTPEQAHSRATALAAQPRQALTQQTLDDVKAGIPARDAEIEALRKEIDTLRAQQEADKVDEERKNTDVIRMLCETLDLARTCHSAMLMSDPPQEMWKARGVDQAIGKALHAADYHRMIGEAHDAARKEQA